MYRSLLRLAGGANPEELQPMRYRFKAVARGNPGLQFQDGALFDFDDLGTARANQVVVVAIISFAQQFVSGGTVPEVEPLHQVQFLEQRDGSVYGHEIGVPFGQGGMNVLDGERMLSAAEHLENRLAGSREAPGTSPERFRNTTQVRHLRCVAVIAHGLMYQDAGKPQGGAYDDGGELG